MKNKIITFSFDDGIQYDIKFVKLLNKYNLKCTFNINTGLIVRSHTFDRGGFPIEVHRLTVEEMRKIYKGHEIASHTLTHPDLTKLTKEEIKREVYEDVENIKAIFNLKSVPCLAYPYGTFNSLAVDVLKENNIKFARATKGTHGFDLPNNLLEYQPSIYYRDKNLFKVIDDFLKLKTDKKQVLCIWGHSYEFEGYKEWGYIEKVFKKLANKDDIDYLTNGEAFLNDNSGIYY